MEVLSYETKKGRADTCWAHSWRQSVHISGDEHPLYHTLMKLTTTPFRLIGECFIHGLIAKYSHFIVFGAIFPDTFARA
jgi:hypothetical protein